MAGYKWHILFGILFAGAVGYYGYDFLENTYMEVLVITPILFFYSILPDIDVASSKARKIVMIVGLLFLIWAIYAAGKLAQVSIVLVLIILQLVQHRKFFHTISAALLFSMPLIIFSKVIALFAFIGYFSHLLLDGRVRWV